MSNKIEFVRNYSDLSTDKGFQFEFCCDRCGTGYRTRFKASVTGSISNALDAAGSLFGGILGNVSNMSSRVHSAAWEKAHDGAFVEAVKELKPDFIQCPRCSSWVCRKSCWNDKRGLCKGCAPDLGVEMSAAQASRSVEEVWAHAKMSDEDKKISASDWKDTVRAACPECEAPLANNAKFCPECGAKLKTSSNCPGCGFELTTKAKFCPECGERL